MTKLALTTGERVEIVPAIAVPPEILHRFYSKAYPNRAEFLRRNWKWQYSGYNSNNISHWPLVAITDQGELVGHASTISAQFRVAGKDIPAAWFVDYYVAPKNRGKGLGTLLIQKVLTAAPLVALIGASEVGLSIFYRFNFQAQSRTMFFSLPLTPSRHQRFASIKFPTPLTAADYTIKKLFRYRTRHSSRDFDTDTLTPFSLNTFVEKTSSPSNLVCQLRDEKFMNWRLTDCPLGGKLWTFSSSHTKAIFRTTGVPGYQRMHILTMVSQNLRQFFIDITALALRLQADELSLVSSDPIVQARATRWFPIQKEEPLLLFSENQDLLASTTEYPQRWELIDSDLDMVHIGT